jgi:hypothetical protein
MGQDPNDAAIVTFTADHCAPSRARRQHPVTATALSQAPAKFLTTAIRKDHKVEFDSSWGK